MSWICPRCGAELPEDTFAVRAQPAMPLPTRVVDESPRPHRRYVVLRDGKLFTATPCYGMHKPWWVAKTMASTWPDEAEPVAMLPDDRWWPLDEFVTQMTGVTT